jgi:hypothetical protein
MDLFFDWVERLPIPYFGFYVAFYVVIVTTQVVLLWLDGSLPVGEIAAIVFIQNIWFTFIGAFWHFARRSGMVAIDRFRPALQLSERDFAALRYRFTHLSARTGWLLTLFGAILLYFVLPVFEPYYGPLFFSPLTRFSTLGFSLLIMPFNLGAFYSVVRMLFSIDPIYAKVKYINLFNLTPLYALSGFTSRMGMVFIIFLMINLLTPYFVETVTSEVGTFYIFFNSIFAVLVFVLPLLGIHRRLELAKAQAAEANNDLIESGFARMHALVRLGKHSQVPNLRTSNSALLEYRHELGKISTWPWDTATLRTFITALAVPMTIWVVQQVLLRTVVN